MFCQDSRTEMFLTSLGVKFEYRNGIMLPTEFAPGWDRENIGRPVAIREDAVWEYATLMEGGSAAPAPILRHTPSGFRVLDGVQRLSATAMLNTTRVSAYVVQTDSEDSLASIRVLANARMQGRAEPAEWTRRRAVEVLVVGRKMTAQEVARLGGWKTADVAKIAEAIELQARINNIGGPQLSDAMLSELSHRVGDKTIEQAPDVVAEFLHTLKDSRIAADDAAQYLDQFFAPLPAKVSPHTSLSQRLREMRDDPEIRTRLTGRRGVELAKDVVLLRTLKAASTVLSELKAMGQKVANVDEFFLLVRKIEQQLQDMSPHKKAQAVRVPADLWSKQ